MRKGGVGLVATRSPIDELTAVLSTLASPHRLRVVAALAGGRRYVSELARELAISRPLLQVHLRKLQDAGLVTAQMELTDDGGARHYYSVNDFQLRLRPADIAAAVAASTNEGIQS